eukprot:666916-Pelagomonas_calceolata.AAC.1
MAGKHASAPRHHSHHDHAPPSSPIRLPVPSQQQQHALVVDGVPDHHLVGAHGGLGLGCCAHGGLQRGLHLGSSAAGLSHGSHGGGLGEESGHCVFCEGCVDWGLKELIERVWMTVRARILVTNFPLFVEVAIATAVAPYPNHSAADAVKAYVCFPHAALLHSTQVLLEIGQRAAPAVMAHR